MQRAFTIVHLANAVFMASTAFPAYLLARHVTESRLAAGLVSALSVAIPYTVMAQMVMTENVAYPAFVWVLLAMQRAIVRPSVTNDLWALAGLALGFVARTQFIILAAILPVAIVAHEVGFARSRGAKPADLAAGARRVVREHKVLTVLVVIGGTILLVLLAIGQATKLLGNYSAITKGAGFYIPWETMAYRISANLTLAMGVLPAVLFVAWALPALWRPSSRARHAFAVTGVLTVAILTAQVSWYDARFMGGDRYLFYLAPIFFVGMAAWLTERRIRLWPLVVGGALFALVLSKGLYGSGTQTAWEYHNSPVALSHRVFAGWSSRIGSWFGNPDLPATTTLPIAVVLATVAVVVLTLLLRRRSRQALVAGNGGAVLVVCVAETAYVAPRFGYFQSKYLSRPDGQQGFRDWIDQRVGADATVGIVPGPVADDGIRPGMSETEAWPVFWDTEFWNKSVRRDYSWRDQWTYTHFENLPLDVDPRTGRFTGSDVADLLVLASTDVRFAPRGRLVYQTDPPLNVNALHLRLFDLDEPRRAAWVTDGLDKGWLRPGPPVRLRVFGDEAGPRQRVTLWFDLPAASERPRRVVIRSGDASRRVAVASGAGVPAEVTVCVPADGYTDVTLSAQGRRNGKSPASDGLRLRDVNTAPEPGGCD
jgi:hypothetical protein